MSKKEPLHTHRPLTEEERARHAAIREAALREFPPTKEARRKLSPPGIATRIREAREAHQLTWYTLAELAGISEQTTIRDIERGEDVKLSDFQRVTGVLGLKVELVEEIA
ncbi:MAG TPA: helix-turn-helix transcriptional regulator [Pirellulales bacterium]